MAADATATARVAYTLAEASAKLGRFPRTLRRLHGKGHMPARKLGRLLMVPASWVDAYGSWPAADDPAPVAEAVTGCGHDAATGAGTREVA